MKRALPALRVGLTLGGLWLALWLALPDGIAGISEFPAAWAAAWKTGATSAVFAIGLAALLFGASFVLGALRFSVLLEGAGIAAEMPSLTRAYLVAGFINLIVPGGVGGDAYRWVDARQSDRRSGAALAGILALERLLAVAALAGLGLFALLVIPSSALDENGRVPLLVGCGLGVCFPFLLLHPLFSRSVRGAIHWLGSRLPKIAEHADSALDAVLTLRDQKGRLARAFLLSIGVQALPIGVVYALSLPLASEVEWFWFAAVVPLVSLASLVPITIAGTGVREALYVALFGAVGMPREVALVLSLLVLAVAAFWAAIGVVVLAIGRIRGAENPA